MIKLLRTAFAVVFALVTAAFLYFYVTEKLSTDTTIPTITVSGDILEISVKDDESALLRGISAQDGKDGDITDRVIVESISKFMKPGICNVKYAVCDNDDHVASATRKVKYTDYVSPVISLTRPLCFTVADIIDVNGLITAEDCIDGDISSDIIVTSADYVEKTEGVYHITVKVTNTRDDTVSYTLPLFVDKKVDRAPVITLKSWLVYIDKNSVFDPLKYVDGARDYDNNIIAAIETDNDVNTSAAGVYSAHYYAVDAVGRQGHTVLTVIVK